MAELFRAHGWSVREGAVCSGGTVDVVAERSWRRGAIEAQLRLLIQNDDDGVVVSPVADAPVSLPFYFFGDDEREQQRAISAVLAQHEVDAAPVLAAIHRAAYRGERAVVTPARVDPPAAPASASLSRGSLPFHLTDAVRADLLQHDLDVLADDLPDVVLPPARCDLLHPIVLTSTPLPPVGWARIHQPSVVGAESRWLDLVHHSATDAFVAMLTRHYSGAFRRRRFA